MPWESVGSLSLEESQAHLAWAFSDGRSRDTFFRAPKGTNTQFLQLTIGLSRFPSEPLPRAQDLGFRKGVNSGHV